MKNNKLRGIIKEEMEIGEIDLDDPHEVKNLRIKVREKISEIRGNQISSMLTFYGVSMVIFGVSFAISVVLILFDVFTSTVTELLAMTVPFLLLSASFTVALIFLKRYEGRKNDLSRVETDLKDKYKSDMLDHVSDEMVWS